MRRRWLSGLLFGWLAACTAGDEPAEDTVLADPLAREAYAFCHEPGVDADEARLYCELLKDEPPEVCPGLRASCDNPELESLPGSGCGGESADGGGGGGVAGQPKEVWRPGRPPDLGCDMPELSFPTVFARWLVAGAVAIVLLLVLRAVVERLQRPSVANVQVEALKPVPVIGIEGDDDLPALPEDQLLAHARRALGEGRIADAVLYARGAALRRLARRGLLRLHKARTDREYLQGVRQEADTHRSLREVLAAVEDLRWAGRMPDLRQATAAVEAAGRILAALLLSMWWSPAAQASDRFGPHGDAAIAELFRDGGYAVSWAAARLSEIDDEVDVVVLDLSRVYPTPEDWDGLIAWVESGGLLIVAGEDPEHLGELGLRFRLTEPPGPLSVVPWGTLPLPRWPSAPTARYCQPGLRAVVWADGESPELLGSFLGELSELKSTIPPEFGEPPEEDTDDTDRAAEPSPAPAAERVPSPDEEEPPRGEELAPDEGGLPDTEREPRRRGRGKRGRALRDAELLERLMEDAPDPELCEPAVVAYAERGDGHLIGMADPRLLRNAALVSRDNREFLLELPRAGEAEGLWDLPERPKVLLALVSAAEESDWSPPEVVANLRLLPFILQLLVAWAVLALSRGWMFTAPRDPPAETRRAFAEHAVALGRQWRFARGTRHAASAFARMWLQRLEVRGLVVMATRKGWTAEQARTWAEEVAKLAADPDGPERGDERTIVEDLWNMTRGR